MLSGSPIRMEPDFFTNAQFNSRSAAPGDWNVGSFSNAKVDEVGNQQIRRFDLTSGAVSVLAGTGARGYTGDGGPAIAAALNMPHEICFDGDDHLFVVERDSHAVRPSWL